MAGLEVFTYAFLVRDPTLKLWRKSPKPLSEGWTPYAFRLNSINKERFDQIFNRNERYLTFILAILQISCQSLFMPICPGNNICSWLSKLPNQHHSPGFFDGIVIKICRIDVIDIYPFGSWLAFEAAVPS